MPMVEEMRSDDPVSLGPYRLSGRLGEGGQGVVYLAEAPGGRQVAVKLLRGHLGANSEARARFMREAETARRVARFCTASVLDADVAGDQPYIVSEYVDGLSLRRVVAAEGARDGGELERLAVGTATALVAIHQAGVVHRDFKPHNVLLGPDGPRVIDFGIARASDGTSITASGPLGTPSYMAPEQVTGERAGPAADVFAWAGTMVFASCGRPPFGADSMHAVLHRVLHEEPDLGALTGPLREIVAACLAKDPAARPGSGEVLRRLLGQVESGTTSPLPPPPPLAQETSRDTERVSAPRKPRRISAAVAVSGAVIAVAAAVVAGVLAFDGLGRGGGTPNGDSTKSTSSPPSTPAASFPDAFAGNWSGRLQQSDKKILPAVVVLPKGGSRGQVSYPNERCSGELSLSGFTPTVLTLREVITTGAERCINTGAVTLTLQDGGTLFFSYSGTEKGETYTLTGPLTRS
ncbi:serine/threonine-protein kinase [Actinomadura rudentiformis]|uniref:serine/threonine-protein kinase n=1 Tax=Actinomadura rudentiformis TaxID=359158 RepID=UPI001CEF6490|nr:serine/threonine-protein kinase [Actinomadura rudentiformis]